MTNQSFITWSEFFLFPSIKNSKLHYEAKVNYPSSYLTDDLKNVMTLEDNNSLFH